MRPIEFRGREPDGEWVYGDLTHGTTTQRTVIQDSHESSYVEPKTVGQYTGFADKDGSKVYEGDVLQDYQGFRYIVTWSKRDGGFVGFGKNKNKYTIPAAFCLHALIGNIHDSPDLLEGGNQQAKSYWLELAEQHKLSDEIGKLEADIKRMKRERYEQ